MLLSTIETTGSTGGGSTSTSTPAFVASAAALGTPDSVTTAAVNTTGADFIVVAVSYSTGGTPALSDNKGNTWTPLTASAVTGTVTQRLYYASNAAVGSGHAFSNTGTGNFSSICVAAFSGVATSSPFDKENGATSSAATIQTGSVTPSVNQELVVSGLGWNVVRTTYPPALDSGFTVSTSSNFTSGNNYGCSIGVLSQATSSALNPTWNLGSAQSDAARIAAFRPLVTPGGGSGTTASTTIRYIATDNLTGANIVLDASGAVAEAQDFMPYGGIRMDSKTNYGGVRNKYAGTVYDTLSGLNYMQARYQNSSRGQFISEDPVFLGDPRSQVLTDPQSMNSYLYANDNPISRSDPTGLYSVFDNASPQAVQYWNNLNMSASVMGQDPRWDFAFNHPYATGAITGLISGAAVISGVDALVAFKAAGTAGYAGASASYVAKQLFAGAVYSTLTAGTLNSIPSTLQTINQANLAQPSSFGPTVVSLGFNVGPTYIGGYTGTISDAAQFVSMLSQGVKLLMNNRVSSQPQGGAGAPSLNVRSGGGGSSVTQGGAPSGLLSKKPGQ